MFDVDEFIASCREAANAPDGQLEVQGLLAKAIERPRDLELALGSPTRAEFVTLHSSSDLTIVHFIWGPGMSLFPHDHQMWGAVGVYGGQEDNVFYKKLTLGGIEPAGGRSIGAREVLSLGTQAIHSVRNPRRSLTGTIHVYGGDFYAAPRTEWDPVSFEARPYEIEHVRQAFEESNQGFGLEAQP